MLILLCSSVLSDGVCLSELKGLLTYLFKWAGSAVYVLGLQAFEHTEDIFQRRLTVVFDIGTDVYFDSHNVCVVAYSGPH